MRMKGTIAIVTLAWGFVVPQGAMRSQDAIGMTARYSSIRHISTGNSLGDRPEFAQTYSSLCVTPRTSCQLPKPAPVGSDCWCATPNGPVVGKVQ